MQKLDEVIHTGNATTLKYSQTKTLQENKGHMLTNYDSAHNLSNGEEMPSKTTNDKEAICDPDVGMVLRLKNV